MNLAGAIVVPAAPLLVPGMSLDPPAELEPVRAAAEAALSALPPHDVLVLLAGAWREQDEGVHIGGVADLGGLSRPDLRAELPGLPDAAEAATGAMGLARHDGAFPVDLATLALLAWPHAEAAGARAVLPLAVGFDAPEGLAAVGAALAQALDQTLGAGEQRLALVAAGDLAAGHTEKAPRHLVAGSAEWDEAAERAVAQDWGALHELGPDEARRVCARGWPALVVLGALLGGRLLDVVYRDAPRGVGYLVASA